jgi:predicted dehydrogenase
MPQFIIRTNRRRFLSATGLALAGATLPDWMFEESRSYAAEKKPASANDKPGILLVGCGGRGTGVAKQAAAHGNVVAVCDVDDTRAQTVATKTFAGATAYNDFRKAIAHKGVDVVVNGTPDHWHTFVNLAALRAGKDVYSEKPLTLTIEEGQRLVKAVKQYKRILQTGSQQRSDARFRLACELVRNGRVGKLQRVTSILPVGFHEGPFKTAPVPAGLDWDFWQGQAPLRDYVPERCHMKFRYWLEYSGGTMTDWGAHHNDIAMWGMGSDGSGPVSVESQLLEQPIPGGYTAPSAYKVIYRYPNEVEHHCVSDPETMWNGAAAPNRKPANWGHGVKFEGTDGWIFVTRGRIEASKPELISTPLARQTVKLYVSNDHMANFFECVRTRKQPICDVEIGHRSVSVCHLGVISLQLGGERMLWNPLKEQFVSSDIANFHVSREQRKPYSYDKLG